MRERDHFERWERLESGMSFDAECAAFYAQQAAKKQPKPKPVYDALAVEEARAPISRYLRGGVPEGEEPPFTEAQ